MLAWASYALLPLSLLASALMAGFFYAYSVSVMPGLAVTDPLAAIEAMRSINAVIRTAVFAFGFFGALVFPLAAALFGSNYRVRLLALAAGIIYGLGAFAVTFAINVPLNDALADALAAAVLSKKSSSKAGRGVATIKSQLTNQRGEVVLEVDAAILLATRPTGR